MWPWVEARLERKLGPRCRSPRLLFSPWSTRVTWAVSMPRLGELVVKISSGDRAAQKAQWCALNLPRLAARGYPVPSIIWHGPLNQEGWHVVVQRRLPGRSLRSLTGRCSIKSSSLALAGDCQTVYVCRSETTGRMANQAFFTRIYLDADDTIHIEPTPSFGLLLDPDTQQQALSWADPQQQAGKRPTQTLIHHVDGSSETRGVELRGLEPLTLCLQSRCSSS